MTLGGREGKSGLSASGLRSVVVELASRRQRIGDCERRAATFLRCRAFDGGEACFVPLGGVEAFVVGDARSTRERARKTERRDRRDRDDRRRTPIRDPETEVLLFDRLGNREDEDRKPKRRGLILMGGGSTRVLSLIHI